MGRSRQRAEVRDQVVAMRLTAGEAAALDGMRGDLSRSEFMRWLYARARREGTRLEGTPGVRMTVK